MHPFFKDVVLLYRDGFRSMVLGRTLWAVILVKLVILFILSQVFFQDYLQTHFSTEEQRSEHVFANLTAHSSSSNPPGGRSDRVH